MNLVYGDPLDKEIKIHYNKLLKLQIRRISDSPEQYIERIVQ